jgi:hypothetical protein
MSRDQVAPELLILRHTTLILDGLRERPLSAPMRDRCQLGGSEAKPDRRLFARLLTALIAICLRAFAVGGAIEF